MKLLFVIFFVTFIALSSAFVARNSLIDGNEIQTIFTNIEDFKEKYPNAKIIPMDYHLKADATRSYTLGVRQTGDTVVANTSNKNSWPVAQNVTTTLTYPSSGGSGAFLTYILINCEQSSNIGQAYVTYGGIHQHFIQIVIDTRITTYFNYAAFFYGIK
ncbi:hypothetical protein PVAND_007183 [Polypedilum vanderplanki]|uniref:Uncharacterized protein n=1 Tax=Polypedilum vanderplanki TaxID=319348 RepID=A0A9J6C5N0_POLVA|nr:hypothetical protein PVAND_007183 [Polypedilum vanderplanki]